MPQTESQSQEIKPLLVSGNNFQNARLDFKADAINVRPSAKYFMVMGFSLIMPVVFIVCGFLLGDKADWVPICVGAALFILFLSLFVYGIFKTYRTCFDISSGTFYPKGPSPDAAGISFKSMDHLEILSKLCHAKSTYTCYELNLVLQDGSRHNILNHAARQKLMKDAEELAQTLKLPVQDVSQDTSATNSWQSMLHPKADGKGRVFLVIFSLLFFAGGAFFFHIGFLRPTWQCLASRKWTSCPAVVVTSSMKETYSRDRHGSTRRHYRLELAYQYQYEGNKYLGKRYDFFQSQSSSRPGRIRKLTELYPAGKQIHCLVNPQNPEESVLSSKFALHELIAIPFCITFMFIGVSCFCYAVKPQKKTKR